MRLRTLRVGTLQWQPGSHFKIGACLQKKGKEVDPVRVFAERVRDHKELDTRWAILQEARVEYFRGSDFITLLRAHPELIKPLGIEAAVEDVELDIGNILIKRKLIMRCDRVSKTPRPGKTKLSKWPARIEVYQVSSISSFPDSK